MEKLITSEKGINQELLTKAVIRLIKQDIIKRYNQTKQITDEDWEFCEQIDWHPVDELPVEKSFIKELDKAERGQFIKFNSAEDLFEK